MQEALQIFRLFLLQLAVSAGGVFVDVGFLRPQLFVPFAAYFGANSDLPYSRGLIAVFVLGYLTDLFSGNPLGLSTFVAVGVFVAVRVTGLRLGPREGLAHYLIIFLLTATALLVGRGLRMLFEQRDPVSFPLELGEPVRDWLRLLGFRARVSLLTHFLLIAAVTSMATTLFAPLVYFVCMRRPPAKGGAPA